MKRFTIYAIAAAMLFPVASIAAKSPSFLSKAGKHAKPAKKQKKSVKDLKSLLRPAHIEPLWRAANETVYYWTGSNWEFDATYDISYDEKGHALVEVSKDAEGNYLRSTYTYDANGMMTSELVEVSFDKGVTYQNNSKKEREYDPIVTDLITRNSEYYWDNGEWVFNGNNYIRTVTRNDEGNVTKVELAIWYNEMYDPTERMEITYGADGKATTIANTMLTYDYDSGELVWVSDGKYENIVWQNTDGQIVANDGMCIGANRIKSADQVDEDGTTHIDVTYTGPNFVGLISGEDEDGPLNGKITYTETDQNGSFEQVSELTYEYEGESITETDKYTVEYDLNALLLLEKEVVSHGEYEEVYEWLIGTPTYDDTYGYPLSYVMSEAYYDDDDTLVEEDIVKVEYSNYIDAGVKGVNMDKDGAKQYYTLQGVKVAKPAAGNIYILRQGSKTAKVLVK